jgi:polygalacturonase
MEREIVYANLKNSLKWWRQGMLILVLFLYFLFSFACAPFSPEERGWKQLPEILNQIIPPVFPARDFNIQDFGAIGDGTTDCTDAFSKAISACSLEGGGRIVVPTGVFLTGTIHLKSNVNLWVTRNATILFSQDTKKYLPVVLTRFEGVELMNYSPFIYAYGQENIAITGQGTLDGQADSTIWWPWTGDTDDGWIAGNPNHNNDRESLFRMAEIGVPVKERVFGESCYLRVNFIQPYNCKNILIDSVTICRSPMWEIHPVLCENVTVQNVKVISHGPNNDGCNPESSKNVLIKNCYFDTGDDCIAIKSGRNADGRRINVPSENIVIQGCTMKDGHGGVVIGSEISGSCRNVFAENCIMDSPHLDRALRIKTNSLRGGVVENIFMRNCTVGEVKEAVITIIYNYSEGDVGAFTPIVRNVFLSNISSQKSKHALLLEGYERSPIDNVQLTKCNFNGVSDDNILNHVTNLTMNEIFINDKLYKK